MPRYRLMKLTGEGAMDIKEMPERLAKGRQYLESLSGKLVEVYALPRHLEFAVAK
jgi:uncharacterized protein with GYD domain